MAANRWVAMAVVVLATAACAFAEPASPTPALPASPEAKAPTAAATPQTPGDKTPEKAGDTGYLPYSEPGAPETPGMLSLAGRVIGSLALVIGLIFVTAIGLRRYLGGTKAPTTSRKMSQLVEVTPLGGKRYLYLIRVADRLLVVGAGGDKLTMLSEITDPDVLAQTETLPRRSEFFGLLGRMRGSAGTTEPTAAEPTNPAVAG